MRLVCPNCEAKYEVPDDAIPDTGRDVQCTNCGHTWFQMRGRSGAALAVAPAPEAVEPTPEPVPEPLPEAEASPGADVLATGPVAAEVVETPVTGDEVAPGVAEAAPEPSEPAAPPEAEPEADAEIAARAGDATDGPVAADSEPEEVAAVEAPADAPEPVADASPVSQAVGEAVTGPEAAENPEERPEAAPETGGETGGEIGGETAGTAAVPAAAAYAVDESVLAILREEAEREANARRAEALESQTELGIDAAVPARAGGIAEADAKPSARRDLLPDVEEINSTLRPSEVEAAANGGPDFVAPPPEAPRGFRSGFLTLMTIAILAAALYLVAPRLAVMVPALAGPLETYVSLIDSLRLGLDGIMRSATVAISGN